MHWSYAGSARLRPSSAAHSASASAKWRDSDPVSAYSKL